MRAARRRLEATVTIASIGWRIVSPHPKPICWAEDAHPAYVADVAPDVRVGVVYESCQRNLPWIAPDTVSDAALVSPARGCVHVRTGYYRAWIDPADARIVVRMAPGFAIGGLMRTLAALVLPAHGGVLVRAVLVVEDGVASLVCGADDEARDRLIAAGGSPDVFDGFVAVRPRAGRSVAFTTPFHEGVCVERVFEAPIGMIAIVRPGARGPRRLAVAPAVGALSSRLCLMDRREATLGRVLDTAARLLSAVPCIEIGGLRDLDVTRHAAARA